MRKIIAIVACLALVATVATAQQSQEERELDLDAEGTAENVETGDSHDLTVNVTGNVTVQETDEGVDETAFTKDVQSVEANVTIDGTTYTIPVTVGGEGTSFEQAGLVSGEAWRLHVQGEDFSGNQDGSGASLSANVTLIGSDGDFAAFGNGSLTVQDDQGGQTTYDLDFRGTATFE